MAFVQRWERLCVYLATVIKALCRTLLYYSIGILLFFFFLHFQFFFHQRRLCSRSNTKEHLLHTCTRHTRFFYDQYKIYCVLQHIFAWSDGQLTNSVNQKHIKQCYNCSTILLQLCIGAVLRSHWPLLSLRLNNLGL